MAELVKETEAVPASYPMAPTGLSTKAAAIDPGVIWQRIEPYIRLRWREREVVWIVEGEGEWSPPLSPATVSTVEVWQATEWVETTPPVSPFGGIVLPGDGPYRITASVGSGTPPAAVLEAFRRLAEYSAEIADYSAAKGHAGATNVNSSLGQLSTSFDRSATWAARAMQYSGAADLLRPYRRT